MAVTVTTYTCTARHLGKTKENPDAIRILNIFKSNHIADITIILTLLLLSNSENREHLKNFRNVDCVLANHNKVQDTQANLKTTN